MTERDNAAKNAIDGINKQYGEGSIVSLGAKVGVALPCIPTGIYGVDYGVIGIGGLPKGRITEIYGPESSGKTTLALAVVASAQKAGGRAGYVDMEHALNPDWMVTNGVNVNELLVSQPDYGEQALTITEQLVESGAFDVVVVDSVAALVPKAELEGEVGDSHMGLQARMMGQALRKISGKISRTNTVVVFINQIRSKIGVMFGSPETTTGGRAMRFYASLQLDVRRISAVKVGDEIVGNHVRIKAAKNKLFPPFRETEVDLLFGSGFDVGGSLIDAAVQAKVVEKAGAWFSYKGERIGQGLAKSSQFLLTNPELREIILKDTRAAA